MIQRDKDILLHKLTKHTNLAVPYSDNVKANEFPEQITELLNTEVIIKYRNHYKTSRLAFDMPATITRDGNKISSRPKDDNTSIGAPSGPEEEEEQDDIFWEPFRVIRADATAPFRLVGISADGSIIVINSTEIDESGEYAFNTIISEYPVQLGEFIGIKGKTQFFAELERRECNVLRVDSAEPCESIIIEEYNPEENIVRIIIGDECQVELEDYPEEELTYNAIADCRLSLLEGKNIYGEA